MYGDQYGHYELAVRLKLKEIKYFTTAHSIFRSSIFRRIIEALQDPALILGPE